MLTQPNQGRALVVAEVGGPVPFVWIADCGDFDASLIGQPLERFGLRVEVKVVATGVTDVDGKLIGLKISARDQVCGIGAKEPDPGHK